IDFAAILAILPGGVLFVDQRARADDENLLWQALVDGRELARSDTIGQEGRFNKSTGGFGSGWGRGNLCARACSGRGTVGGSRDNIRGRGVPARYEYDTGNPSG